MTDNNSYVDPISQFRKIQKKRAVRYIGYCRNCDMTWEVEKDSEECPECESYFDTPAEPDRSGRPILRVIRGTAIRTTPPCGVLRLVSDSTARRPRRMVGNP